MPATDHPLHTGELAVSPRLTGAEHERLRAMSVHPAGRAHRPGDVVPWEPTADGRALRVVDVLARDEPIAEWAAYLLDHLADAPVGAGTSRFRGTVTVVGVHPSDRWTLCIRSGRVVVVRCMLPCPSCWDRIVRHAPTSGAYAFDHPDGNVAVPVDGAFDRISLQRACPGDGWAPSATERIIGRSGGDARSGTRVA